MRSEMRSPWFPAAGGACADRAADAASMAGTASAAVSAAAPTATATRRSKEDVRGMRELYDVGRVAGLDVGERRIGVAVSDVTGTLARPVGVLHTSGLDGDAVERAVTELVRLASEEDGLASLVVGLPRRLDGSPNDMTPRVQAFVAALRTRVAVPVVLQDERWTSREAESRLAIREKDWRARKKQLDAAAAAIILQDYLDEQ